MRAVAGLILLVVLLLACCALPASAESPEPGSQIPRTCSECVVRTPAEVEQEKAALAILLQRAFELGRKHQAETCASLI